LDSQPTHIIVGPYSSSQQSLSHSLRVARILDDHPAWHVDSAQAEPGRDGAALVEESKPDESGKRPTGFANFEKNDESHQAEMI